MGDGVAGWEGGVSIAMEEDMEEEEEEKHVRDMKE